MIETIQYVTEFFIIFIMGVFTMLCVDIYWNTRLKKIQPIEDSNVLLKWHEHYHTGLELVCLSMIVTVTFPEYHFLIPYLLGLGFMLMVSEWSQDHPFAWKSEHFKQSTFIGTILVIAATYGILDTLFDISSWIHF